MVDSLKPNSQEFLYFDTCAPQIDHSVDSRMNEVGTRATGAKSINGLEAGVEHDQVELDRSGLGKIDLEVVRCSNLGCTRDCSVVTDVNGKQVETRHVDECMNRTSADGTRVFKEYNYKSWAYEEQRTTQQNSGVWEVTMSKTGNAASTRELLRVPALQTALLDIGEDGGCPDRVRADQLIETTEEHLRHIYAEVRGDAEGCTRLEGRGPKCDIRFDSAWEKGTVGLICGDCGSKTEECKPAPDSSKCPKCHAKVNAATNQMITCTQQQCRSRGKTACRKCCVRSFENEHYYQHTYQPKGFEPLKWRKLTIDQW